MRPVNKAVLHQSGTARGCEDSPEGSCNTAAILGRTVTAEHLGVQGKGCWEREVSAASAIHGTDRASAPEMPTQSSASCLHGPGLEGSASRRISRGGAQKPAATCPRPSSQGRSAMRSMPGFNRQYEASGQEEVGSRTLGTGNCPSNCLYGGLISEALSSCEGPAPLSFSSFQPFTESKNSFHLRFFRALLNKR